MDVMKYNFGDVDIHGSTLGTQAAALEAKHQQILSDVTAAADFWGGVGSNSWTEFVTALGRNFQVIFEQLREHGTKVRTAGNNMASTDSSVGASWA